MLATLARNARERAPVCSDDRSSLCSLCSRESVLATARGQNARLRSRDILATLTGECCATPAEDSSSSRSRSPPDRRRLTLRTLLRSRNRNQCSTTLAEELPNGSLVSAPQRQKKLMLATLAERMLASLASQCSLRSHSHHSIPIHKPQNILQRTWTSSSGFFTNMMR